MTGPEHYLEAQRVVDHAEDHAHENDSAWYANAMAAAQVHATLALAAATAMTAAGVMPDGYTGNEWRRAIIRPRSTNKDAV